MPLRDHFHSPLKKNRWDSVHGMWPAMIVQQFYDLLPKGFVAAPGVHLGKFFEVDVSAYEENEPPEPQQPIDAGNGGVAVAAPPRPTLTVATDLTAIDEYEVRVYDEVEGRELVAVIEIVSPSNKDRPENRRIFAGKVAAFLDKEVCVSIVDLVTVRQFSLYAELLELIGAKDPSLGQKPPYLYAVTIRTRKRLQKTPLLDVWHYPMKLGEPLPAIPIWLDIDKHVMLPLEPGYEETCRLLHIK